MNQTMRTPNGGREGSNQVTILAPPFFCPTSVFLIGRHRAAKDCDIKIRLIFRNSSRLPLVPTFDEVVYAIAVSRSQRSYLHGQLGKAVADARA